MINLEQVLLALKNKPKNNICYITDENYTEFANWQHLVKNIDPIIFLPEIHLSFYGNDIGNKLVSVLGEEDVGSAGFDCKNYILHVDGNECTFIHEHGGEAATIQIIVKDTGEEYTPNIYSYAWGIIKRTLAYAENL